MRLEIELVPRSCWGRSLAQELPRPLWDKLRRMIYRRYLYTCRICRAYGEEVHCHEVWKYHDGRKKIQELVDLTCLCKSCHEIKHWGRTSAENLAGRISDDYIRSLTKHYCFVNECSAEDFLDHKVEAHEKNHWRSRFNYTLDLSKLQGLIKETERILSKRV